ncbi:hypothetical protein Pyn_14183 [Prunus yedoensis var. nudiflora]|uniref:Uncharacterized protein n=1 Tax=Prunus yedoensis var. nudiflora TaxID=2094558 RepID=A0A314U6Z8_PRUYE|nr:hypothetical protein Pyn_14183 [Prunus yedoensis var. nudiflora]
MEILEQIKMLHDSFRCPKLLDCIHTSNKEALTNERSVPPVLLFSSARRRPLPSGENKFLEALLGVANYFHFTLKMFLVLGLELEDELVTLIAMEIQSRFPNRPWA